MASISARSFGVARPFSATAFCIAAYACGASSAVIGALRYEPHAHASPQ
jgi:hypothetical protein